jgi:hypothetical protein
MPRLHPLLLILPLLALAQAPEPPYGLAQRVPWTTSRLAGSPDPPASGSPSVLPGP